MFRIAITSLSAVSILSQGTDSPTNAPVTQSPTGAPITQDEKMMKVFQELQKEITELQDDLCNPETNSDLFSTGSGTPSPAVTALLDQKCGSVIGYNSNADVMTWNIKCLKWLDEAVDYMETNVGPAWEETDVIGTPVHPFLDDFGTNCPQNPVDGIVWNDAHIRQTVHKTFINHLKSKIAEIDVEKDEAQARKNKHRDFAVIFNP